MKALTRNVRRTNVYDTSGTISYLFFSDSIAFRPRIGVIDASRRTIMFACPRIPFIHHGVRRDTVIRINRIFKIARQKQFSSRFARFDYERFSMNLLKTNYSTRYQWCYKRWNIYSICIISKEIWTVMTSNDLCKFLIFTFFLLF